MLFHEISPVQISDSVIPLRTIFDQIISDKLSPFLFTLHIEISNLSFFCTALLWDKLNK